MWTNNHSDLTLDTNKTTCVYKNEKIKVISFLVTSNFSIQSQLLYFSIPWQWKIENQSKKCDKKRGTYREWENEWRRYRKRRISKICEIKNKLLSPFFKWSFRWLLRLSYLILMYFILFLSVSFFYRSWIDTKHSEFFHFLDQTRRHECKQIKVSHVILDKKIYLYIFANNKTSKLCSCVLSFYVAFLPVYLNIYTYIAEQQVSYLML